MKLYCKYLKVLWKCQMQYRASFLLLCFGQFLVPFFVFAGMYILFERFQHIAGWTFYEVLLCFGIIHMVFATSECFVRGFDRFSKLIIHGEFDRILVRPRSLVIQVLGSEFAFLKIGSFAQSLIVLIWALMNLSIQWTALKVILIMLMFISGFFVFSGIFILAATLCFWTIQGLEVTNIFTHGGKEMAQYPLGIYKKWLRDFFTYVIPFGCVNYYPMMYLLDKNTSNNLLYILSPLFGIVFIIPCLWVWYFGVRHYKSTGS